MSTNLDRNHRRARKLVAADSIEGRVDLHQGPAAEHMIVGIGGIRVVAFQTAGAPSPRLAERGLGSRRCSRRAADGGPFFYRWVVSTCSGVGSL